jgi:hypothetical protein
MEDTREEHKPAAISRAERSESEVIVQHAQSNCVIFTLVLNQFAAQVCPRCAFKFDAGLLDTLRILQDCQTEGKRTISGCQTELLISANGSSVCTAELPQQKYLQAGEMRRATSRAVHVLPEDVHRKRQRKQYGVSNREWGQAMDKGSSGSKLEEVVKRRE